jgi:hypothetical protein
MRYTISVAFVLNTEDIGATDSDPLHRSIVAHVTSLAELLRAQHPDREFSVVLSDMIFSTPEVELCPRQM